jgi:DUF4097 and DUF4098 domain-containing protein YvlB
MTITKNFPLDGPVNLHVRAGHGSVTVHAREGVSDASVVLTACADDSDIEDRTTVDLEGRTLHVLTPRRGGVFDLPFFGGTNRDRDSIDITVTVPAGTAMKISSFTSSITIDGRCGGADLASGTGEISVAEVAGDLRLRFASGTARAERVDGSVQVRSGSGSVVLGDVTGTVDSGCGSGRLEVRSAHGSVRSRSGSGTAVLRAVFDDVDLATGSGGVEIGLPAGHSARLEVTTGSGRVDSDLPIEQRPSGTTRRISIRARTGSGDVRLFRAG